jgi:DNA-3-methyladenine glycosylase I
VGLSEVWMKRCEWCEKDDLYRKYHDEEWGVPVRDDQLHFEFLVLEAMQAGLSWHTVLRKRENFRIAFDNFDYEKVAKYDDKKFDELISDAGIIRNKAKINATINNAQRFIEIRNEFGSFDKFIWSFVGGKPQKNKWKSLSEIPAKTELSDKVSKELLKRGFKFVGSTIIYAHLQATGIVNDHLVDCWRY